MSYHLFASVYEGIPQLVVRDSLTGQTLLCWHGTRSECAKETQYLFRELILLTCRQELVNTRVFSFGTSRISQGNPLEPLPTR